MEVHWKANRIKPLQQFFEPVANEMIEIWKPVKYIFMVMGFYFPKNKNSEKKTDRLLVLFFRIVKLFCDVMIFYFMLSMIYGGFTAKKIYFVHVADIAFVNFLWFLVTLKIKFIIKSFERMEALMIYPQKNNRGLQVIVLLFCAFICINALCNTIRVTVEPAIVMHMQYISTFGVINKDNSDEKLSKAGGNILRFIGGSFNLIFFAFPPTLAVTLFLVLLQMRNLTKDHLKKLQTLICEDDISINLKSFLSDFTKVVAFIKNINESLSPITFALMAFWTTGIFYNLSKLLYHSTFDDIFSLASSSCNAINYTIQFLIFVILSSEIPKTVAEMKNVILRGPESQEYSFFDEQRSSSISLLVLRLENFKEQVTISGLGLFELERRVILICLGAGISYELLIVQLMERND
ncbi:uncharacterized protein TNIN_486901 [Trichonephila inaurata madagascariensis]|uniref:Gustatory receptor n=1 Tax=Trichonephila inaurata madagascariensis TaxID=2747483 RepID=A0A8X6WMJ2_9ARAC|nr:uncharacterized protein TNIN_486901 [Trichonephila inaurata madagascariensis]